jgi:hypothetical protein
MTKQEEILGKKIYPKSMIDIYRFLHFICFMFIMLFIYFLVLNIIENDFFNFYLDIFGLSVSLISFLFLSTSNFVIYENGFITGQSFYNIKFRNIPAFLKKEEIIAISPIYEYDYMNNLLRIETLGLYYSENKYVKIQIGDLRKKINNIKKIYGADWNKFFIENYNADNFDWENLLKEISKYDKKFWKFIILITAPISILITYTLLMFLKMELLVFLFLNIMIFFAFIMIIYELISKQLNERSTIFKKFVILYGMQKIPEEIEENQKFNNFYINNRHNKIISFIKFKDWLDADKEFWQTLDKRKKRFNKAMRLTLSILIIFIIVDVFIFTTYSNFFDVRYEDNKNQIPSIGNIISNTSYRTNQSLYIEENLIILENGNYSLKNCSIFLNNNNKDHVGIYVKKGGILKLENCVIKGNSSESKYKIEIYGKAIFVNCSIYDVWGTSINKYFWTKLFDGGIEVHSNDVLIYRSKIIDSKSIGIFIYEGSPKISNSLISNSTGSGLVVLGGEPEIKYNNFSNNRIGIVLWKGSPKIEENRFENNSKAAIYIYYVIDKNYNDVYLNNNYYYANTDDIYFDRFMSGSKFFMLISIGFISIITVMILLVYKDLIITRYEKEWIPKKY